MDDCNDDDDDDDDDRRVIYLAFEIYIAFQNQKMKNHDISISFDRR